MYKHHEESIENMISYFKQQGAVALILGGSVAKGTARADSDLDGFVILTEEDYAQKEKTHTTTETINGMCTYEDGYFDIKYMTKEYLKELAQKGSEPARNGFTKARILFSNDSEIEELLPQIPIFQKSEKQEKRWQGLAQPSFPFVAADSSAWRNAGGILLGPRTVAAPNSFSTASENSLLS